MMMDPEIIERLRNAGKGTSGKHGFTGGLFQEKRNSISMLTDPSVVAHLNQLNQTAMIDQTKVVRMQDNSGDQRNTDESSDQERLSLKIAAYNQGRQGAFLITQRERMNYEGALRIYFEDGSKMIAKAVWLTNNTTVDELMPSIRLKFNTMDNNRWKPVLYKVQNHDEILLDGGERPLDIAINSKHNLRFILRMEPCLPNTPSPQTSPTKSPYTSTQRKSLTQFFGVDSSDLAVPYYATPTPTSPVKTKLGSPRKRSKKQNSVDSLSLSSNGSSNSSRGLSSSFGNGSTSGMVLKTQTPKFIKRFQLTEGSPRLYAKKGSNGKHSSKGLEPCQRSRAKSLSLIFDRTLGLGKKVPLLRPVSQELSSEESAPGLLKIFGDQICQSSTYKSVLASGQSSAVELVKVVLERYSLPVSTFGDYVLCDVIGNYKTNPEKVSRVLGFSDDFEEKQEWVVECMRVLGDDERPLTIQSFWKPDIGYARRFEIRRRTDIEPREVDTITHEINMNAKWLQCPKEHRLARSTSNLQEDEDEKLISSSSSENDIDIKETQQEEHPQQQANVEPQSSNRMPPKTNLLPPSNCPYLVMLQGGNPETDQIMYQLDQTVNRIGHHGGADTNIQLDSTDVNLDHCRILKQQSPKTELEAGELFVVPARGSKVLINGSGITKKTQLNSGDVLGIGDQYLFLLRNPLPHKTKESALMRLLSLLSQTASYSVDTSDTEKEFPPAFASQHLAAKAEEYSTDHQRLKISYPLQKEDEVLREVASLLPSSLGFSGGDVASLSMSYMMCMCVEYSAYNFHTENTHRLMLKVAALIQTLAWDKTKETAANQQEKPTDIQSAVAALFPDIRVIVGLLSNALEILNFLQTHMDDYIVMDSQDLKDHENKEESGSGSEIQDDTLTELEEVVMYTFQQMVYYLTKTLYIAIPIILDTNPFSDGSDEPKTNGMDSVLSVFQMTFDLMQDLDVHPGITSQLFAYLFFFTNASLFNMLVERGSDGSFYKWSKGVQIRGNLDALEGWIHCHDLKEQGKFLQRVSTAIALLATPKVQLIQADWKSLQHDFSGLNSTQLHHFLSQYQLGDNQPRPTAWLPPPEEMKSSIGTDDILESFDNHPALELPNHGLKMNLKQPISNEHFTQQLHKLKRCLPYVTISMGTEDISDIPDRQGNPSIVISDAETTCPSTDDINPVPPPRTKSYRLSQSDDADCPSIEVLNRPLEVTHVAPVAMANTVKLQQTDAESKRMSPRVFSDAPVFRISETSKDSESEKLANRTDNTNTNNSCDYDKTITSTIVMATAESTVDTDVTDEEEGLHNYNMDCHGNEANGPKKPQTFISHDTDATGHLDEYEEPKKPCPTLSSSDIVITLDMGESLPPLVKRKDSVDDVFIVDLEKGKDGVGLGLIDGMHTPLQSQGIYVRKLVPGGSALQDGRFMIGDRILAVNGTSLVGADYNSAMQMIRTSGTNLRFLVAKSEPSVALKITATSC